jgi:DNA helicase-2/ATP-dependent DNA helicase PcrA
MSAYAYSAQDIAKLLKQHQPTEEQTAIIEAPLESMLVVAGAGSGKTETMSARVVWLIANGIVQPAEVLGLTFTRKAAGELSERVRLRLIQLARAQGKDTTEDAFDALNRPTISTYNSYASSLVQEHGLRIGREPGARLLSEASQWAIVNGIVEQWQGTIDTTNAVSTLTNAVISLSGALNEHLLSIEEARERLGELEHPLEDLPPAPKKRAVHADVLKLGNSLSTRRQLLDLVHEYGEYKRTYELIDFSDQVALAATLAEDVRVVGELERERFKVVLLDEYQDTSYAQIRFLSALYGKGHPVTAVGDPNQSIYAWRGASAAGPARFPEQFRTSDGERAQVYRLGTSWRNDTAILDVANTTSAPLYAADPDNSLPSLKPRLNAGRGKVHAAYYETIEDEATAIAEYLREHWKPGERSAAVLCRKRSQFPLIESTLRAHGIPVEVVGLGGLLSTPEVVDLVAFLEAVHDPSRGDSLMRLLTGPRVNLGASDLIALGQFARKLSKDAAVRRGGGEIPAHETDITVDVDPIDERSILDAIVELPDLSAAVDSGFSESGWERLREVARLLDTVRSLTYLSVPELIEASEKILGLDIEMALAVDRSRRAGQPVDPGNPFGRAHLDALYRVAVNFCDTAMTPTLGAFLAWLDDALARERGLERPVGRTDINAVQLITIHASKGLEWDVVVVPGLVDGQFPNPASRGASGPKDSAWLTALHALPYPLRGDYQDLPQLEYASAEHSDDVLEAMNAFKAEAGAYQVLDERRLAYVAFTRARSCLFLSGAWWREGATPGQPSQFLLELVDEGVAELIAMAPEPEKAPRGQSNNPRNGSEEVATWPYEQTREFAEANAEPNGDLIKRTLTLTRRAAQIVAEQPYEPDLLSSPMISPTGVDLADLTDLLLSERDLKNEASQEVEFPAHISVSGLVEIDKDREGYARARRRPIPREPSIASRRGTTFHLWVERHFGKTALFDLDDLPGADDDLFEADTTLEKLIATFEASPWARLQPIALEQDVDIVVAGTVIRARIDAVFPDPENPGGVVVVDWKTGREPSDMKEASSRELQLALYRIAWAQLTGTPLEQIGAAFFYVAGNTTVRPTTLATLEDIEQIMRVGRA